MTTTSTTGAVTGASHDLLDEPILRWQASDGPHDGSLPDLLAALVRHEVRGFPRLRAHQAHPWHAFLVQVAALALRDRPLDELPDAPSSWRDLLLDLADGQREAWCLVVADEHRPAFLQAPWPEGMPIGRNRKGEPDGTRSDTPAMTDTLKIGRNHDLKTAILDRPAPEHWVQALVSTQTCGGFEGRGIYGIVRMNGGFASRGAVAAAPSTDPSDRFRHDLAALRESHDRVAREHGFDPRGHRLLWLHPWNRSDPHDQIPLGDCDPWFVEIGRALRLFERDGALVAYRWAVGAQRVGGAAEARGVVGDPWLPVLLDDKQAKAMNVPARGFGYSFVVKLLLDARATRLPVCADEGRFHDDDTVVIFQGLARGQGGTAGYHERVVHVPRRIRSTFFHRPDARERLHALAASRIQDVDALRSKVLRPALLKLVGDGGGNRIQTLLQRLDRGVDDIFFERLWEDADLDPDAARMRWLQVVEPMAREILDSAPGELAVPLARRFELVSSSRRFYFHKRKKVFPDLAAPQVERGASEDRLPQEHA